MSIIKTDQPINTEKNIACTRTESLLSPWRYAAVVFMALATLLSAGCSATGPAQKQSSPATEAVAVANDDSMVPVNLSFAAEFGGKPFDCAGEFSDIGISKAKVTVSEYKLFVSRVRMIDKNGNETPVSLKADGLWQQPQVALLDFENAEGHCSNGTAQTNSVVTGMVAKGSYRGVAFDVGVPFDVNHDDPTLAASPMNLTSMFWNWRGGYRFMRIDLAVKSSKSMDHDKEMANHASGHSSMKMQGMKSGVQAKAHGGGRGWAFHVGSTGCESAAPSTAPSSCANPNRIELSFNNFNPETDTLVIDPAQALKNVDVTSNTPETAPGCMSSPTDPECSSIFTLLGLGRGDDVQQLIWVR